MDNTYPTLEIDGLPEPVHPYAYEETYYVGDDLKYVETEEEADTLSIAARVRLSPEQGAALRELWKESRLAERYLSVRRVGLDDEPRSMRFGQPRWSRHDDHEKHQLILVDRSYDNGGPKSVLGPTPEQLNETARLIDLVQQMDTLLTLLVERGKLSQQDVDRVREVSPQERADRTLEFKRVNDLDDWQ
jgi:hypothetical protein